jgi:hypothetical protein
MNNQMHALGYFVHGKPNLPNEMHGRLEGIAHLYLPTTAPSDFHAIQPNFGPNPAQWGKESES